VNAVALLGIVKHAYARLGDPWELERYGLRGPQPRDWAALTAKLGDRPAGLALAARLEALLGGLAWPGETDAVTAAAARLAAAMEAVAGGVEGPLWSGPGGEAMARLLAGLVREADGLPPVTPRGFADLLQRLMERETVRVGGATHPRLRILGAIEARLVSADRLVLAGLEEGVWPGAAPTDPFLSRPMRAALGLPPPERRIGLAAHDFAQAACAAEVVLLHTERREGAPSVKSRWLWRLETLAKGAGVAIPARADVLAWARALDAPGPYAPCARPSPAPPVADRPDKLFVTRIETLTRDPYAVWARDILKLRQLERLDEAVEARARGTAIHKAFERFVLAYPQALPPDAAAVFRELYLAELGAAGMPLDAMAREQALATEAAQWVAELEARRRADGRVLHVETEGSITLSIAGRPFTLAAKADRIEVGPDGLGHVLDYKTGRAPSQKMVNTGFSPQLTLTAAVMAQGGFGGVGRVAPGELTYLEVTGRKPPGRETVRAAPGGGPGEVPDSGAAAERALEGMTRLIERFSDPAQGYASRTAPQFVKLYVSDYDHLARVFEWSTSGEDDE
jgi:ATP-dependent helicase/nuclease subunit B